MSACYWNPREMGEVFVLPAGVVDRQLSLATPEQLRVLLWFSRHQQQWDAAACAAALGIPAADCEGCLRFWLEQGVLQSAEGADVPATPATKAPSARPAAVKPLWQEVLAYQQTHREFLEFQDEVSARLGKALSHGEDATLLYLVTTAGLPQASVLLITAYAVAIGKPNIRYIEKIALDWADEEVITPQQVEQRINRQLAIRESATRVETILELTRSLTAPQAEMAHCWLTEWGFSPEMLRRADTISREKHGKFHPGYINGILDRWQAEGIKRPDQIPAPTAVKKKGPAATNPEESSLDMEGFEAQLLRYRPKFNKAKG